MGNMPRREGPPKQERIKKSPSESWSTGQIAELRMRGAAHEDDRVHNGISTSVSLYNGLIEKLEEVLKKQKGIEDPEQLDPVIEEINKRITYHLQSEITDLRIIIKSNPAGAKDRLTLFEANIENLVGPLTKIDERRNDPFVERPSPVILPDEVMRTLYKDWERSCDELYGLSTELVTDTDLDEAIIPEGIDRVRLAYLKDRAAHVLVGVGFFGFHRFDELRGIVEALKNKDADPQVIASLEEMLVEIPDAEIKNLSQEFEPAARYWRDQTTSTSDNKQRLKDRAILHVIYRKLEAWKKRSALTLEAVQKWEALYAGYQKDFGSLNMDDTLRH